MKKIHYKFWGLVSTLVLLSPVNTLMAGQAQSWNLRAAMMNDISKNPTGVWAFMENTWLDHKPSHYQLMPNYSNDCVVVGDAGNIVDTNTKCWEDLNEPYTFIAITKKSFIDSNGKKLPSGFIGVHPATSRSVIVRWKSPVTGNVNISGIVSDSDPSCGDGISYSIDTGAKVLRSGKIPNGAGVTFAKTNVAVRKGQSIYFMVFPDSSRYCDSTNLDILITNQ